MRGKLTLLLLVIIWFPAIAQINKAEYFIDTDPGFGKASAITITTGNDVSTRFNVPLANIQEGLHTLYVRARDAAGHWSLSSYNTFYNTAISTKNVTISKIEYFIDKDPGIGMGTAVSIQAGQTVLSTNFNVNLTRLSTGTHIIYVRTLDNKGSWSVSSQQLFFVKPSGLEKIAAIKYNFVRAGFESPLHTYPIATPATSVDLNFKADLSDLPADQQYTMQIYAVSVSGVQSLVKTTTVKVCSQKLADAGFSFVQSDFKVNFTADSAKNSSYKYSWDFGDGAKDSIPVALHQYAAQANYKVKLITTNFCNSDTVVKTISVDGLKSIYANRGGNTGPVTVNLQGSGFITGTQVFLNHNGQHIPTQNLNIQDVGLAVATFDLSKQTPGLWDVVAIFPGGKSDTLYRAFTIEQGGPVNLSVAISGDRILRIGFNQVYTVTYTNSGNTDVGLVPIFIGGLPKGTNIDIQRPLFDIESVPGFENLGLANDGHPTTINDDVSNTSYRMVLLPKIPANSSGTMDVIFHLPDTTSLHSTPEIVCSMGTPYLSYSPSGNTDYSALINSAATCGIKIAEAGLDYVIEKYGLGKDKDLTGIFSCFGPSDLSPAYNRFVDESAKDPKVLTYGKFVDFGTIHAAVIKRFLGCTRVVTTAAGVISAFLAKNSAPLEAAINIDAKLTEVQEFADKEANIFTVLQTLRECDEAFNFKISRFLSVIVGNAFDPNALYGPGDQSAQHYTNQPVLDYTVNFENKPSSNLNAQTVTVLDTLRKSDYDLNTFGFTSVTIGDSTYKFSAPVKSFIHDFDFVGKYSVKARVVASFDTLSGIAQWKFFSIDPATNQVTTNALAGFLPPDISAPQGQGLVSYQVAAKAGYNTGSKLNNQAFITFDHNPVIPTNTWNNVFDLVSPLSKIKSLPATSSDTTFTVNWAGTDNLSGIRHYDIYYAVNNSSYFLWNVHTTATSGAFTGKRDSTYSFYCIATDNAGNTENAKNGAEATIKIVAPVVVPVITAFKPSEAKSGDTVKITGTGFTGVTAVNFGNTPATSYAITSATSITAVVGNGASGGISVTSPGGSSTMPGFIYLPKPSIASVDPLTGKPGSTVTITGTGLTGATAVSFGGIPASSFTINSATSITAIVGSGAGGTVSVSAPGGSVTFDGFSFLPAATITASGPLELLSGGSVVLTANQEAGYTFKWYKNGLAISGANSASFTATESGSYTAGIALNGLQQISAPVTVHVAFDLPATNFTITNTSVTCKGSANGSIGITAAQNFNYTATITANGTSNVYPFNTATTVGNLAPGNYDICITVEGQANYKQCFTAVISEPKDLSLYTAVIKNTNQVVVSLDGGNAYNVTLNGVTHSTTESQLTLKLQNGVNKLVVNSDKPCQGEKSTTIVTADRLVPFPNPFENTINVNLGNDIVKNAFISLYDKMNKLVYSGSFKNASGVLTIDAGNLKRGVFFLKLSADDKVSVFKMVKQ
ncbi:T9SS type A sorting domain-containing protein [Mucilaginibacter corticis]|uniref:T9SS type A sorting domain-containing protein n=1 Tax=Mucilaginibacter corticis TaxID=2597670 RepID=A0A556M9S4_9SPHI|nr:PKD domain-containing protein [Mucilaginibacter corticis]TSJ36606.1 T9SS type A sorting domain-containing protein [Mucilaginibacter corticis]